MDENNGQTIIDADTAEAFEVGLLAMMGMTGGRPFLIGDTLRDGTPVVVGGVDELGDGNGPRPVFIMITEPVSHLFRDGVMTFAPTDQTVS